MSKFKLLLLGFIASLLTFAANAASDTVTVDVSGIVSSIQGLGTIAQSIIGASILVALTVMIYRRVKGLAAKG